MRNLDQRIYRTFEEFEREELRRLDTVSASVDDIMDTALGEELDFERGDRKRRRAWDDDEE